EVPGGRRAAVAAGIGVVPVVGAPVVDPGTIHACGDRSVAAHLLLATFHALAVLALGASGPRRALPADGHPLGHQLAARPHQVDLVLDPARVDVAADPDQRPAAEVPHQAERSARLRHDQVRAPAVAGLALGEFLV